MCGIYGFQWNPANLPGLWRRTAISVVLGINNAERGTHSWGMYSPEAGIKKGLGSVVKVAHAARKFNAVLAHTRFATHGDKTVANAHPFHVGNIIGAHNGIIYNHTELNKRHQRDFEVDSQHILAHLNEEKPLKELEGYGTCEWVDTRQPGKVNLVRLSSSGELCIVETPYGVLWSSDEDHLEQALEAAAMTHDVEKWDKPEVGKKYIAEGGKLFWVKDSDYAITGSRMTDSRTSGKTTGYRSFQSYGGYGSDSWGDYSWDDTDSGSGWKNEGGNVVPIESAKKGKDDELPVIELTTDDLSLDDESDEPMADPTYYEWLAEEVQKMTWEELRDTYSQGDGVEASIADEEIGRRTNMRKLEGA